MSPSPGGIVSEGGDRLPHSPSELSSEEIPSNLMPNPVKSLAKKLLDGGSRGAGAVRHALFVRQCRRDAKLVEKVSSAIGAPQLAERTEPGKPGVDDVLFVLAGGATVNELSAEDWQLIENHVSIGINFWPIHPFVPNILTTETDSVSPANPFLTRLLEHPRIVKNPPEIFILRTLWPPKPDVLPKLPDAFQNRRFVYGRANLITRRLENLPKDLRRIINAVRMGQLPQSILPDNGSSVVRLTFYAIARGFRQIVWVGVDQNSGHYFWTQPPVPKYFQAAAKAVPRSVGEPHSTSDSAKRSFSNDDFLRTLGKTLAADFGIQIYVSSENSSLSDSLPVFSWDTRRQASSK